MVRLTFDRLIHFQDSAQAGFRHTIMIAFLLFIMVRQREAMEIEES